MARNHYARSETVRDKPSYRTAWRQRRYGIALLDNPEKMRNGFNSPTTPLNGPLNSSDYRERDVLRLFADGLPDSFEVFHNLPWSSIHQGTQHFGELDLVVISPVGHVNSESHYGCGFNIHLAKLPDKF